MTHFSQRSNADRHSAPADAGSSSLQPAPHTPGALAGHRQSLDLSQDDIVRPELRNDAILAGRPARERRA
ncbi:MAG TPA: hypothetical protein VK991_13215 [Halomonas sp.]|nr:hypothetical protein [Halomonas sp.]